jgi:hypothetical protein
MISDDEPWVKFITELGRDKPQDSRLMFSQFSGEPGNAVPADWRARVLDRDGIRQDWNVYVCVSAMGKNERGEYRRRRDNFKAGLCLMIDDIGDGAGAKFPISILKPLPPTAIVETSPRNYQAVYMFDEPLTDADLFNRLINGFIAKQFMAKDTGMAGINRVFRPPVGVNAKRKYMVDGKPFQVRLVKADYGRRYGVDEIVRAFDIPLAPQRRVVERSAMPEYDRQYLEAVYKAVADVMKRSGAVLSRSNLADWVDVICPWSDEHSDGPQKNTGAALRSPNPENDWVGAFNCHHGSCSGENRRGFSDVVAKLATDDEAFAAAMRGIELKFDNDVNGHLDEVNAAASEDGKEWLL